MSDQPRSEFELDRLSDEELIAEIVAARDAGQPAQARMALMIFSYRRFDELKWRAQGRLQKQDRGEAEDIAAEALKGALNTKFRGQSVGEAVRLMQRIVDNRVADFYRRQKGKDTIPLADDLDDEQKGRGTVVVVGDGSGVVLVQDLIDKEYAKIESSAHHMVIDLKVFQGFKAKETAELVNRQFLDLEPPMSASNVDQIASRFKSAMKRALSD